jgi:hypothetical protein
MPVGLWQEVQALLWGAARRVALSGGGRNPLCYPPPQNSGASASLQRPPSLRLFQFFDHGGWSFCALQEWRRHIYQLEDVAYQMRGLAGRVALNGGTAPGRLGED